MEKNVPCAPSPRSPAIGGIVGRTWYWRVRNEKHNGPVELQCAGLGADLCPVGLRDEGDEQQNDPRDDGPNREGRSTPPAGVFENSLGGGGASPVSPRYGQGWSSRERGAPGARATE